jgi:DNA-binding response OmpR family regulator
MINKSVLVIEDLPIYQKLIQNSIGSKYVTYFADSITVARNKIQNARFDLIILDVGLPDGSGFDFFREIQESAQNADVPIIFLTARDTVSDKILGFTLGAEDYVTKPFDPAELLARIDSKLAKYDKIKTHSSIFTKGPFRFDLNLQNVFLDVNEDEVKLCVTPTEYKLFLKLVQNAFHPVARRELKEIVWSGKNDVDERNVDKHISSLRKKLGEYEKCISSSSGIGYVIRI